jgi:parallel beta-helix repeat protein
LPRPVSADYAGPDSARRQLDGGFAQPTALATDDFDEDGVPDLVCGYIGDGGGLLTLHLGNVDAIYPHSPEARLRKATGAFTDAPFLTPAQVFETPAAPDFLGAGDFDNDGYRDIVAAARGGSSLYLFPGNGRGGLGAARSVVLSGHVTAMIAGEIDRRDGLADLVVGIDTDQGPAVLIFEGPEGALDSIPEVITLPAPPNALALGRLDDDVFFDLAVGTGEKLMILRGRNSMVAGRDNSRSGIGEAVLEGVVDFDSPIVSISVGRYAWDERDRRQMALLFEDGALRVMARAASPEESQSPRWHVIDEQYLLSDGAGGQSLVTARVSGLPMEELVVLDRDESRLLVMLGELGANPQAEEPGAMVGEPLPAELDSVPVAVLPMRLNRDALSDLVLLQQGKSEPAVAASETRAVITVDDTTDSGPAPGDGYCRLSEAIANANANGETSGGDCIAGSGADRIEFAVTTIDVSEGLPAITDPGDMIDGTTACDTPPCVELYGNDIQTSGLTVAASGVVVRGLIVTDFGAVNTDLQAGILVTGGGSCRVEGNTVKNIGGSHGIWILDSTTNTVGGTTLAARNVSIDNGVGVALGAETPGLGSENRVLGNYVGTDGTEAFPNTVQGVNVWDAALQEIGGTGAGEGNVISGNGLPNPYDIQLGIVIHSYPSNPGGADGCTVQGNLIGLNANGTDAMSNENGIWIWDAAFITIGGSSAAARNVISGNSTAGINVIPAQLDATYTHDNVVQGNYIGTDVSGTVALGNGYGVQLGAFDHLVKGNVISGNDGVGVKCAGGSGHRVEGNRIGTDVTGTVDLGNSAAGVVVTVATNNTIGGTTAGARNVISGNGTDGVVLGSSTFPSSGNQIQGNFIGLDVTGTVDLGNTSAGVRVLNGGNNTIGGTTAGASNIISGNDAQGVVLEHSLYGQVLENVIAHNGQEGILVRWATCSENTVQRNSIHSNGLLGIDLGDSDGVTLNDPKDPDTGPNLLQNFPALATAVATPIADVTIEGTLNSMGNKDYRIEFFANGSCDPSGWGEGERYLGFTTAHTSGNGNSSFAVTLPASVSDGESITATATDPDGNTSEFSECFTASCSSSACFGEMMLAQSKDALGWTTAQDVRFCRGDLAGVSSYTTIHDRWLLGATSVDISGDDPAVGSGLYYLVKPLGCGSWETAPGSEPGRDSTLP